MNSRKVILISSVVFLLAAGCNSQSAQNQSQVVSTQPSPSPSSVVQPSQTPPVGQTQAKQNAGQPDYFPNGLKPGSLKVAQQVYGSDLAEPVYNLAEGQTAEDLLKATHHIDVKSYSFGDMVTGIDGMKSDSKHFWEFFVNGKSSNVGASSYKLQSGDKVEWKLSEIK